MSRTAPVRLVRPGPDGVRERPELDGRLGLNVPNGWWPAPATLKAIEAAGFAWVQVHAPPRVVLCDPRGSRRHARALRRALDTGSLRLVLHGPDDLSAGESPHDRALEGLIEYAADTGAEYVVYHGANFPLVDGGDGSARLRERVAAEEDSLRRRAGRIEASGAILVVENLAPVWPGPPHLCHAPERVRDLVEAVGSPAVRMLFDVGHAHIVGDSLGIDAAAVLAPVADAVATFHLHDNLGARGAGSESPGLDPLTLDLHLPPRQGTVPWERVGPFLTEHDAPLVLEVHPPHRPEPVALRAALLAALGGSGSPAAPRSAAPGRTGRLPVPQG